MAHKLYHSVDELLAPETLTKLTGSQIKYVRCMPMEGGLSGSSLLRIEADCANGTNRFVLKRMASQRDWIMAASNDQRCRSVTLWQSGLLDRLQPTFSHTILACARDDAGWALLMEDVSSTLVPEEPLTNNQLYLLLYSLASLHATFWEATALTDPELGLCSTEQLLQVFTPATGHRFADVASPIPKLLFEGWYLLQDLVAPDVVDVLDSLYTNSQPLCDALARYPMTLVHGDFRGPNLGITWQPTPQTILFDWQLAGYSAATIDLAWFFSTPNVLFSPVTWDDAAAYYRQRLAAQLGMRFDNDWWQPLLALGQLVNVLRRGSLKARSAAYHTNEAYRVMDRKVLDLYSGQVRAAVQWL
ncbi:MAG: phosphotransferase [Caldilineaceae bacterium]|nr:phosphotransferase [Caldilineaceae bacterium]